MEISLLYYLQKIKKENADKDDRWNQVYWSFGSTGIITAASSNVTLEPGWIKNCTRKIQRKCLQKKYHHCRS